MAAPQRLLVLAIACGSVSPALAQQWMPGGRLHLPFDIDAAQRLASSDFDGDGTTDLLVANDGQNRLLLNDGTAVFRDATAGLPAEARSFTEVS